MTSRSEVSSAPVSVRPLELGDMVRFSRWGHHQDLRFRCYDFPDLKARRGGYRLNALLWFLKRNIPGLRWVYGIEDPQGNLAGYFKIVKKRFFNREAELSMVLDPASTGKGYGSEAFFPLLRICFEDRGLSSVWVSVVEFNTPSRRLLEKAGFVKFADAEEPYDDQINQQALLQSFPEFFFMKEDKLMCRLSYLRLDREVFQQLTPGEGKDVMG